MSDTVAMRLYVPTAVDDTVRATAEQMLITKHGGATTYDGRGSWESDGRIVTEDVTVIECVAEASQPATDLKRAARVVKALSDEDAVMWEIRQVEASGMV